MPDQNDTTTVTGTLVIHGTGATLFGPIPNAAPKVRTDVPTRFGVRASHD